MMAERADEGASLLVQRGGLLRLARSLASIQTRRVQGAERIYFRLTVRLNMTPSCIRLCAMYPYACRPLMNTCR